MVGAQRYEFGGRGASHEQEFPHLHRWFGHRQPRPCRLGSYRDPRDKAAGDHWIGSVVNHLRNGASRRSRGITPDAIRRPSRTALRLRIVDPSNALSRLSLAALWLAQQPRLRVAAPGTMARVDPAERG